jgi:AcrR family transcriptional regulator
MVSTMTDTGERDPRIERSVRLVREAALAELAERGYGGFGIESVSRRCGVAKSTIYRHWPDPLALVADAFESLDVQPPPPEPDRSVSSRARIAALLQHLADAMDDSVLGGCLPVLVEAAAHDPGVRRFLRGFSERRRTALVTALRQGVESGELDAGLAVEDAALALSGAIIYCRLMTDDRVDADGVARLMSTVLRPAS